MRRCVTSMIAWTVVVGLFSTSGRAAELESHPKLDPADGWKSLFNGEDLTGWITTDSDCEPVPSDTWAVEDGALTRKGKAYLRSEEKYRNFILDLEFKVGPKTNSGILLRHKPNPELIEQKKKYWYHGLIEVQIFDSFGKEVPDKHDCGALYDMVAPTTNTMKKPGRWNRLTICASGGRIVEILNGRKIMDVDLNDWTEAAKNPDGTHNKYQKPMKDLADAEGYILLQDHPGDIWFRNIYIKPLD